MSKFSDYDKLVKHDVKFHFAFNKGVKWGNDDLDGISSKWRRGYGAQILIDGDSDSDDGYDADTDDEEGYEDDTDSDDRSERLQIRFDIGVRDIFQRGIRLGDILRVAKNLFQLIIGTIGRAIKSNTGKAIGNAIKEQVMSFLVFLFALTIVS